ncbi:Hypothetical predicted protein [Mytilus galloprovincialis]|uniref:Uncharacterized protein n=1 Tax=Mytilus galloprovincialis TaxID=29158 RepID=A0A8B6EJK2_MYTGA|nr:Hypothetical predicted protein [Mytilus galloprovincialis]
MPVVTVLQDDADTTTVMVEGQMYNFDDRTGFWSPWSVSDFISSGLSIRKISLSMNFEMAAKENTLFFQKRQILRFNKPIFTYPQSKYKLHISHQIEPGEDRGKSYVWNTVIKDAETHTVLLERAAKLVAANISLRKPIDLPKWFRHKYSAPKLNRLNNLPDGLRPKSVPVEFPNDCYQWRTKIRYSDLNGFMHTHQSVYTKLCLDAITSAALGGKLQHFIFDICFYPIEYVDITFIGESFADDELLISILQSQDDGSILHCLMEKDKKSIAYLKFKIGLTTLSKSKY